MPSRPYPTRRLPKQPNLEQLRKQAKDLLHADPQGLTLSDAQRVLARSYGFQSWPKLKAFVDGANVARLVEAVEAGDAGQVRRLVRARPELVTTDLAGNDERRALHFAVMRRDAAMVRWLMQAGADARQGVFPHRDATTAFALARDRGYQEIVAVIEEEESRRRPAVTTEATAQPGNPLASAVKIGDAIRVRELVSAHPDVLHEIHWSHGGLLSQAVQHGQIEIVRLLLDLGADVDERVLVQEVEDPTPSWGTPLWYAALEGRREIAELLLNRGADPNANVYASGWPLRNAWMRGHEDVKQLLLERGAKPQPYMVAELGDAAWAQRLLDADGGEELARELTWSAACHGQPDVVRLALPRLQWEPLDTRWHWILVQPIRGADDDGRDHRGFFTCLELLLAHGADPNVSQRFGQTVLHFAAARHGPNEAERARFAAMLLDHGARVDRRDHLLESTPLGWACRWGRREMVELLMARGAPVEEADAQPWATPLAWAAKMGHTGIAELLGAHKRSPAVRTP